MQFVACHIERERKRKWTNCWENRLTSPWNSFFSFWVYLLSYVSFESSLIITRKREKENESPLINNIDNLIFLIILSLLHESCVFYCYNIWATFHLLIYSFRDSEIFFNLDDKKDILNRIQLSLLTGVF